MKVWIVVEGESYVNVLTALLPEDTKSACEFVVVGGRSNITSVARTLLGKHREPVAVMRDADSLDPATIREKYVTTNELLQWASGGIPYKVVLCIPCLEAMFFESPEIVKMMDRLFPKAGLSSMIMFYCRQPKETLDYCFAQGGGPTNLTHLLRTLADDDMTRLRTTIPIREISEFIDSVLHPLGHANSA